MTVCTRFHASLVSAAYINNFIGLKILHLLATNKLSLGQISDKMQYYHSSSTSWLELGILLSY
jgi:hypothetical protein